MSGGPYPETFPWAEVYLNTFLETPISTFSGSVPELSSHTILQFSPELNQLSLCWLGMGRKRVSRYTAVWKIHGFNTTKKNCYTVPAVCTVFYVSSKTESAGLPQLCAVKSARVTQPLPLRLEQGCKQSVSESQLCVWWWPKEMNPCNLLPRRKHQVCRMEFFR